MKFFKAILITFIFIFSLTISATYGLSRTANKQAETVKAIVAEPETGNVTLNGDLWFALTAIVILGGYIVIKSSGFAFHRTAKYVK